MIIHLSLGGQWTLVGGVRSCVLLMDCLQQRYIVSDQIIEPLNPFDYSVKHTKICLQKWSSDCSFSVLKKLYYRVPFLLIILFHMQFGCCALPSFGIRQK
jgi:hypothetical protein